MVQGMSDSQLDLIPIGPHRDSPDGASGDELVASDFQWAIGLDTRGPKSDRRWLLERDVILCECPDCGYHVSVRLWLMMVDCWNCGASFELVDEQPSAGRVELTRSDGSGSTSARVVQRAKDPAPEPPEPRRVATPASRPVETAAAATAAAAALSPAIAQPLVIRKPPERRPPRNISPSAELAFAKALIRRRTWDWLTELPAWLMSLVFHLLLLLMLALLFEFEGPEPPSITLAMVMGPHDAEGDSQAILADENAYDRIAPTLQQLQVVAWEDADHISEEALKLRLDPDTYSKHLPKLEKVLTRIESDPHARGTVVTRDPRLRDRILYNEGGTTATEAAVARGLHWLAGRQQDDGSWRLRGPGTSVAGTGLALLPFLGAGQTHKYGHYQELVTLGLNYLMSGQSSNGDLRANSPSHIGMYVHGQATIVLCEALSMTRDSALRKPAQRAVDFIVRAQHPIGGGWRYEPRQRGDTSVLGWQLMALHSARAAGLEVPQSTLKMAGEYLDRAAHQDGALYGYIPDQPPRPAMTAEGLLCRIYLGWPSDHKPLLAGADFIAERPFLSAPDHDCYYYWYYATQTLHHLGGPAWDQWNERIREELVEMQTDSGTDAGSWPIVGPHAHLGTEIYCTSLAVCTLEVYYRHAPIFRRVELGK